MRPPWDQTGVPGEDAFFHFHSSTISGSARWMMWRTLASVFPRQSPSAFILWSIKAEADSIVSVSLVDETWLRCSSLSRLLWPRLQLVIHSRDVHPDPRGATG